MKLVVLLLLFAIIVSLGSGLFYLSKDDKGSRRLLNSLRVRVVLSATLVALLVTGYFMGWIAPPTAPP